MLVLGHLTFDFRKPRSGAQLQRSGLARNLGGVGIKGAVPWVRRVGAGAVVLATAAVDLVNRAAAHIARLRQLVQQSCALRFELFE